MSDTSSVRSSMRASTMLNRPQIAPMGPRTRQGGIARGSALLESSTQSRLSALDLTEFGGRSTMNGSPTPMSPSSSSLQSTARKSLPPLSEEATSSDQAPAYEHESEDLSDVASSSQVPLSPFGVEPDSPSSIPYYRDEEYSSHAEVSSILQPPTNSEEHEYSVPPYEDEERYISQTEPAPTVQSLAAVQPEHQGVEYDEENISTSLPHPPDPPVVEPPVSEFSDTPLLELVVPQTPSQSMQETEPSAPELLTAEPPISEVSSAAVTPTPGTPGRDTDTPTPSFTEPAVQAPMATVKASAASLPPPRLIPPAPIKFESTPVPWKGLPLDAALWTVDSGELQDVVSRAIRSSASESFVRLLTAENLDKVLPAELERLESLKIVTQSKYRFLVHRRTMLFQALNSTSLGQQKDGEDGVSVVSRLATQLADTIGECDKNLEEVLRITDQIAQINKLIDTHWSSALAIALRKLNGSYARRTVDLTAAKDRIAQLEAELGDAWKEAERVAQELDDYEAAIEADDTVAIIGTAEVVAVPKPTPPTHARRASIPMSPTLVAFTPMSPTGSGPKTPALPPSPGPSQFVFPEVHLKAKETEAEDVPDTVSTRSAKSYRSAWTAESNSHVAGIQAAKKRGHRASQSSLRLNTGHVRMYSDPRSRTPYEDHPPVPELPVQFAPFNGIMSAGSANASSALINHFDTHLSPRLRRQVSLDSVRTGASRAAPSSYRGRAAAVDDLYIRSQNMNRHPLASSEDTEINNIPRTFSMEDYGSNSNKTSGSPTTSRPPAKDTSKGIPSMWMNVDAVKPHATPTRSKSPEEPQPPKSPVPSSTSPVSSGVSHHTHLSKMTHNTQASMKSSTYDKIRGLTKRYSVSLPLFNSQSKSSLHRGG
ncbi:hypothetical protein JR316_0007915 [Psilocybe cubensis]|uniref:Uncharacterized protein n=2 Tax=Psilocybe cubensis TaxID=181762 RepID=A0A8H8CIU3_PSICU|nr:hypothetical protein JR316_0007915 [Psilocybe cubensis]KAH9479325.1 hypothetical protein JR316_0007915 [Psilocybe cubensis]